MQNSEELMRLAIDVAKSATRTGDVPVGAIVINSDGVLIGRGFNEREANNDPTAHAEIVAIRNATSRLQNSRLDGCTLIVTLEPCAMCAGAIYWTGLKRVVFGLTEKDLKAITGDHPENPTLDLPCHIIFAAGQRQVEVIGPMLEAEAAAVHEGAWS